MSEQKCSERVYTKGVFSGVPCQKMAGPSGKCSVHSDEAKARRKHALEERYAANCADAQRRYAIAAAERAALEAGLKAHDVEVKYLARWGTRATIRAICKEWQLACRDRDLAFRELARLRGEG